MRKGEVMKDITELLKESNSNIIKGTISSGGVILGARIENFKNVLVDDDKLSNDLAEKVDKKDGAVKAIEIIEKEVKKQG